jgi:hypothetical protein
MITFNVVRDRYGWAIRIGEGMTTPFRLKHLAVYEATCLADAIRRHGECAEVIVESTDPSAPPQPKRIGANPSARLDALQRKTGSGSAPTEPHTARFISGIVR